MGREPFTLRCPGPCLAWRSELPRGPARTAPGPAPPCSWGDASTGTRVGTLRAGGLWLGTQRHCPSLPSATWAWRVGSPLTRAPGPPEQGSAWSHGSQSGASAPEVAAVSQVLAGNRTLPQSRPRVRGFRADCRLRPPALKGAGLCGWACVLANKEGVSAQPLAFAWWRRWGTGADRAGPQQAPPGVTPSVSWRDRKTVLE